MTKRTYSVVAPTPGHATWTHHVTHCVCECDHKTGTRPQMTQHLKLARTMHERAERKAAAWAATAEHVAEVLGREAAIVWADRMAVMHAEGEQLVVMSDEDVVALSKWSTKAVAA